MQRMRYVFQNFFFMKDRKKVKKPLKIITLYKNTNELLILIICFIGYYTFKMNFYYETVIGLIMYHYLHKGVGSLIILSTGIKILKSNCYLISAIQHNPILSKKHDFNYFKKSNLIETVHCNESKQKQVSMNCNYIYYIS